jgi:hypothetical protein
MLIHTTATLWIVISISVGELFGSIFLNTAVMGIADFVANVTLLVVMPYFQRQVLTSLNFTPLGVCLITSSIMRGFFYNVTRLGDVGMMIMAKFFSSSKFNLSVKTKLLLSRFRSVIFDHVRIVPDRVSPNRMRLLIPSRSHLSCLLQLCDACWRRGVAMAFALLHGHNGIWLGTWRIGAA